jgi:hypothetical protein
MGSSDLTESMSDSLVSENTGLADENTLDEDLVAQERNGLFNKISFNWRPEDRAILDRIKASAEGLIEEVFGEAIATIDRFYEQLRVPETVQHGNAEVVCRGADGRVIWKRNESGKLIERWDQLTGQDIEMTISDLLRIKLFIAPEVNRLLNDAIYAKHVAADAYDDAWGTVVQGTQGDRTAKANRASRSDRYHAHFRFVLYSTSNTLLREIAIFISRLSDIREWQIRSQVR